MRRSQSAAGEGGQGGQEDRHAGHVQARHDHHGSVGVQLRHAGAAAARTGVFEQRPQDHADRRAHGSGKGDGVRVPGRHQRVHQAPESRQERAARKADPLRGGARDARKGHDHDGSGAAVQRRLLGERVQLRQQHQHGGWRHAPQRIPLRADAHDQRIRPAGGIVQGREGKSLGRRRPRRPDRGGQREGAAAAVRRADQGQAQQRHRGLHDAVRQRQAGRVLREERGGGPQDRRQGDRSVAGERSGAQGAGPDAAQRRAGFRRASRENWRIARRRTPSCARFSWSKEKAPAAPRSRDASGGSRRFFR